MISYAQNFEDVMLRRIFRDQKDGFYIDVGAMDPVVDSVTKTFYDEGWSGINIEPNEFFYNKLVSERPRDINLNLAIGASEEEKDFYVFEHVGNSTFDEASRDRYVEKGYKANPTRIRVSTLAKICDEFVKRPIDFLKIDCEGWEKFVVQGADWDRFRPTVVLLEATEPGTDIPSWAEWEPDLLRHYEMVYFDGLNRFYLNCDKLDLRKHFMLPPNFHDNFKLFTVVALEWARDSLTLEQQNLTARISELENGVQAISVERNALAERLQMKEAEASQNRDRVAQLENERNGLQARVTELTEKLVRDRLWIGQLSQDLAACKQVQS